MKSEFLVTTISRFGDLFCVAGIDLASKSLMRPRSTPDIDSRSSKEGFWSSDFVGGEGAAIYNR